MSKSIPILLALFLFAATSPAQAEQGLWREVGVAQRLAAGDNSATRYFDADSLRLKDLLEGSPTELSGDKSHLIELPMPDGSLARFAVVESPIMEAELAASYPQIKTYKAYGVDDPNASGRLSYTANGFGGMLRTSMGRLFIDADAASGIDNRYIIRSRATVGSGDPFQCAAFHGDDDQRQPLQAAEMSAPPAQRLSGLILTYRLAVAATAEYVARFGGAAGTTTEIAKAINRVNEFYERDHGIRLILIGSNPTLYEIPDNGVLTNNSGTALIGQVQAWIDGKIGNAAYDVGHIFSTGAGGLAFIGSACNAVNKAQGVTGLNNPVGDPFYIDFVAHEIGHQFNADHTFNGTTNSCGGINRNQATAFEPGSGSTIMAYAGICGVENLQNDSEPTFHAGSIAQIDSFTAAAGNCYAAVATNPANNNEPVIATIADRSIPILTAFQLNGSATDADAGTTLSYQWDQMNTGSSTDPVTYGTDRGDNPLFRSYRPQAQGRRDFPALGTQLGTLVMGTQMKLFDDAEVMPCQSRAIDLRLTVRDNDSGQDTEDVRINAHAGAGPFRITNFNTVPQAPIIVSNNNTTVTWEIAKTDLAPVSCSQVDIELLTFSNVGYAQYSVHSLEANSPNDGTELVQFPQPTLSHPRARLRVKCSDNYFYDINDTDLVITGTSATQYTSTANTTFFNNNGTTGSVAPVCGTPINISPQPAHDSGAFDLIWLLFLAGLAAVAKRLRRQG